MRALQEKAGSLEISLEQVCGELDAAREHVQRLMDEQDYAQSLREEAISFLMSCLSDIKKRGIPTNPQNASYVSSGQGGINGSGTILARQSQQTKCFCGLPSTVSTQDSGMSSLQAGGEVEINN